jgi:hypothetical protein
MFRNVLQLALAACLGVAMAGCAQSGKGGNNPPVTRPSGSASAVDLPSPSNGVTPPSTEPGVNPLFTLPPSKGPEPHKFSQISLNRSGPSGELEMQLTGDGIYRIRDHGRGRSYSGNGQLTAEQIAEWAAAMKDWESLKEDYRADPKAKDGDTVEILYGGKRVVANIADKENPKTFTDAYKRLLDLNEQAKKEAGEAEPAKETPEKKDATEKKEEK